MPVDDAAAARPAARPAAPVAGRGAARVAARVAAVTRTYRVRGRGVNALRGVDAAFASGALTVIAGPSGSGKSSLLRILACVERPDSGSLDIAGRSMAAASARRRRRLRRELIGYVFQDPIDNLVEYLDTGEQVRLAARLRGRSVSDAEIDTLLGSLHLAERRRHRPQQLSGGEQQRVAVACAMVGAPVLVVGDEPTAELDSAAADRVLDGVRTLCAQGATFVLASHDPRVIDCADHVLRLDHGTVIESW